MNAFHPHFCRPEAYRRFADSLSALNTTNGLIQAAISVSLHALDDFDPGRVETRLTELAEKVSSRVYGRSPEALIAHLHHVLYEEEGFVGERAIYYNPLCSFLPAVLEIRRGIPIMLALVYKAVGERVGLEIDGVNTPGHFLVRVRDSRGWLLIDPYHRGQSLSSDEAYDLVDRVFERPLERTYDLHTPATHAQWIERILANLQRNLGRCGFRNDLGAMTELQSLLSAATPQ